MDPRANEQHPPFDLAVELRRIDAELHRMHSEDWFTRQPRLAVACLMGGSMVVGALILGLGVATTVMLDRFHIVSSGCERSVKATEHHPVK